MFKCKKCIKRSTVYAIMTENVTHYNTFLLNIAGFVPLFLGSTGVPHLRETDGHRISTARRGKGRGWLFFLQIEPN